MIDHVPELIHAKSRLPARPGQPPLQSPYRDKREQRSGLHPRLFLRRGDGSSVPIGVPESVTGPKRRTGISIALRTGSRPVPPTRVKALGCRRVREFVGDLTAQPIVEQIRNGHEFFGDIEQEVIFVTTSPAIDRAY